MDLHFKLLELGIRRAWIIFTWEKDIDPNRVIRQLPPSLTYHKFYYQDHTHLMVFRQGKFRNLPRSLTDEDIGRILGYPSMCKPNSKYQFSLSARRRQGKHQFDEDPIDITTFHCDSLTQGFKFMKKWTDRLEAHPTLVAEYMFEFAYYLR